MFLLGGYLTLMIGPTIPIPAPEFVTKTIESVSVQESDSGRTAFSVTFAVGRDMFTGAVDFLPLLSQVIKVGHRVVIMVVINAQPHVISDGIVTKLDLTPGLEPGQSRLSITGTDVSALMELIEWKTPAPATSDLSAVTLAMGKYAAFLVPAPIPPIPDVPWSPTERTRTLSGTDYDVLTSLAKKNGYVFYVTPGKVPGINVGYWGPLVPIPPIPQPALTVRMGNATNVNSISFSIDGDQPVMIAGNALQEKTSGAPVPVVGVPMPPLLGLLKPSLASAPYIKVRHHDDPQGGDALRAIAIASAKMVQSEARAVTASGELDVARYGNVLRARKLVGVRGAGLTFDGNWYCSSVSHSIARGKYTQSFSLMRDGVMSNTPVVRP